MNHHQQSSPSKTEKFITSSMLAFMNEHIQSIQVSILDEIILNYVATVLESLALESGGTLEDSFDVEEFCEIVGAYFPQFTCIPHHVVSQWIFDLVTTLRKSAKEDKPQKEPVPFESLLNGIETEQGMGRTKRNSESSSDSNSSYCGTSKKSSTSTSSSLRSPRVSETSDADVENDVIDDMIQSLQSCEVNGEEKVETLREMFPNLTIPDAIHVMSVCAGDLEKAVQMVLLDIETGALALRSNGGAPALNLTKTKPLNIGIVRPQNDEKVLKDRIVARYGFIDQAEDKKEFRPPPLKTEPKKLVRYRESQVVSTKGERYSEVRCKDGGEVKNYINKPHKQHN